MNRYIKRSIWLAVVIHGLQAVGSAELFAGELESKSAKPDTNNIGFINNPPKELKDKFPMCDAFLKVTWIDKEKKIGYSRYNFYEDGKKAKQKAFALINIDQTLPHFDYDLSRYDGVKDFKIEKVFSIIKSGDIFFNRPSLGIKYDAQGKPEHMEFYLRDGAWNETLADHRLSVCIPYPDNKRVWIAETKRVDKIYGKEKIDQIAAKLKMMAPDLYKSGVGSAYAVDLNFDGIEDYFIGEVAYSYGSQYYAMKELWVREIDKEYGQWSFPPTRKKCQLEYWLGPLFLTTDGKSYFLNNQCNLTELTSPSVSK